MQLGYDPTKAPPDVPSSSEDLGFQQHQFMLKVAGMLEVIGIDSMTFSEIEERIMKLSLEKYKLMVRRNDILERMFFEYKRLERCNALYDEQERSVLVNFDEQKKQIELSLFGP